MKKLILLITVLGIFSGVAIDAQFLLGLSVGHTAPDGLGKRDSETACPSLQPSVLALF
jgi:hypothetical protein